ncbi:peptidylprolyl isomerase [uncultured Nevskia sp.]|uniref:peptidylprolyl isomerase n=1 Tax=uncultured Nevskia sp. TaxID=228950 RepID=UPI00345DC1A9
MTEAATVSVLMQTSLGDMTIELDAAKAPKTVANFLAYVDAGHYDGLAFHRVIKDFMIQGGGYVAPDYTEKKTGKQIENECNNGLKNSRGTIAMARTSDPHSATSQFFINHGDNAFLDGKPGQWGYAVFGKLTAGTDVLDKIGTTPTGRIRPFGQDVPVEPVVIVKVSRV